MAELAEMFPGIPTEVLRRTLEQHRLRVDACIEPLLAMSDPDHVFTPTTVGTHVRAQTDPA
jgi:hypothetical protein